MVGVEASSIGGKSWGQSGDDTAEPLNFTTQPCSQLTVPPLGGVWLDRYQCDVMCSRSPRARLAIKIFGPARDALVLVNDPQHAGVSDDAQHEHQADTNVDVLESLLDLYGSIARGWGARWDSHHPSL